MANLKLINLLYILITGPEGLDLIITEVDAGTELHNKTSECKKSSFCSSYKIAEASTGFFVGTSTPPLSFLFLLLRVADELRLLSSESVAAASLDSVRSMVSFRPFRACEALAALLCDLSLAEFALRVTIDLSGSPVLRGAAAGPLCSGGSESLEAGEQDTVSGAGLDPGGSEREDRMQLSIGNNLDSMRRRNI